MEEFKQYYGRLVIKYKKSSQQQGRFYKSLHQKLIVQHILSDVSDGDEFPGYDKVKLSHQQLFNIIDRSKRDWMAALENQKAVYLITDKNNGKQYVGSATSRGKMLLDRWTSYAKNGHGGNTELVALINGKGIEYIKEHFQYTILENYNGKVDDDVILKREVYWKEVLQSRKFDYNAN